MGNKYGALATKPTPQSKPLRGREKEMVKNDAGGYVFALDKWKTLERFLILGAESNTYYVGRDEHFNRNVKVVDACIAEDPKRVVEMTLDVSVSGRAPKNDPAEFVLASMIVAGGATRKMGYEAMPHIVRTGRTLLEFNILLDALGVKWNATRRNAFSNWYIEKSADQIAYQVLKYPTASGWSHLDILRKAHPRTDINDSEKRTLFNYIAGREPDLTKVDRIPLIVSLWEQLKRAKTEGEVVALIKENPVLTWELIPGEWQGYAKVWEALLPNLPYGALIRNLGRLTSYGILKGVNDEVKFVRDKLTNRDGIRKARIHPLNTLVAWRAYTNGGTSSMRANKLEWNAQKMVSDALEDAFYLGFDVIEPSGKDMLFGIDVSGSMSMPMSRYDAVLKRKSIDITCAEAAAVLAMVGIRSEKNSLALGFSNKICDLGIGPKDSLDAVLKKTKDNNFGSTDCAAPMIHALDNGMNFDQFIVLTDNETWHGKIHPSKALEKYRQHAQINAKLVVVGMISSGFSIADPKDPGMLDVVGFDTTVPAVISEFARGE